MNTIPTTTSTTESLVRYLASEYPEIEVLPASGATDLYSHDRARADANSAVGPNVALPASPGQVQVLVREAVKFGVSIVPRGAGSGLSGGASATTNQLVISTERLNRLVAVSPLDQVAVVEPGVINASLNPLLEEHGLFYAPDPASYEISALGGNIATNAGGLHCAKYGVTGDSVLALDVVLPDGELIHVGHRSIKGVAGLDLVSLFVGSEGILGIIVGATLRLRKVPVAKRTITAFFDSTLAGAYGLGAITQSPVEPAVVEFFDEPTLKNIDTFSSASQLRDRGASLILIELDGYGIEEQIRDLSRYLEDAGARVTLEEDAAAERLWALRRGGRGNVENLWIIGEDIAVPKSKIPDIYNSFDEIASQFGVQISSIAHAGDGNLHPQIKRERREGEQSLPEDVLSAADALVQRALQLGGTVSGEHGIGTAKQRWLDWELSERNHELQRSIRDAVDPRHALNPGKAI